jgi:hypothetical protein
MSSGLCKQPVGRHGEERGSAIRRPELIAVILSAAKDHYALKITQTDPSPRSG